MAGRRCRTCNQGAAAKARNGLCASCWQVAQPHTVDGVTIKRLREDLSVSINDAAAAIGSDPKYFVDKIEDNMELDVDEAAMIQCAIEALYDENQARQARPVKTLERTPPPAASLAIDGIR